MSSPPSSSRAQILPKFKMHYQDEKKQIYCLESNQIGTAAGAVTVCDGLWCCESENKQSGKPVLYVAVKVVNLEPEEHFRKTREEVNETCHLDHPNLLTVEAQFLNRERYWIVFGKMDASLRNLVNYFFPKGVPEISIKIIMKEVVQALNYLHQEGLLHEEVNPSHIYYNLEPVTMIKIGFRHTVYEDDSDRVGEELSPESLPLELVCNWAAAPEIYYRDEDFNVKSDVWMVGITMIYLVLGGIRVSSRDELEDLICELTSNEEGHSQLGKKPLVNNNVVLSTTFKDLLSKCLSKNDEDRPSANEILEHDFFSMFEGIFDITYLKNEVDLARLRPRK